MLLPKKSKNNPQTIALMAILFATAIWGFAPVVIKGTLDYLPPFTFLFYRFLIVCLVLLPYMCLYLKKQSPSIRDLPALVLVGLLGQTSLILIFVGLKYTTSIEMSIIGIVAPIMLAVAGHYFYRDELNKYLKIGLAVASVGTLILTLGPIMEPNQTIASKELRIFGNLLVLLYQVFFVTYVLWSKRIRGENSHEINILAKFFRIAIPRKKYGSFFITGLSFYVALASMLPLYVFENQGFFGGYSVEILRMGPEPLFGLIYMSIFSSIVAYGLFDWSLKHLKVTDTVVFSYLAPIFTIPAAFIVLQEIPTSELVVGSLIIAVGIVIAEKRKS